MAVPREAVDGSTCAALMNLMGYSAAEVSQGVADSAALGVLPQSGVWMFRLDLVTVSRGGRDSRLIDDRAGHVGDDEAQALFASLLGFWQDREPGLARGMEVYAIAGGCAILVDRAGRDFAQVETTPPVSVLDEPWAAALPRGGDGREGSMLRRLVELSAEFLESHDVNQARTEEGLASANLVWIWGGGAGSVSPSFEHRFGLRAAMLAQEHTARGVGTVLDMAMLPTPTNLAALPRAVDLAMADHDFVCIHVDLSSSASSSDRVNALEALDEAVIGPVLDSLREVGSAEHDSDAPGWRIMVAPGAVIPDARAQGHVRVADHMAPFAIAGDWVRSVVERDMNEADALASDLAVDPGHDLMEYYLRGGLARARRGGNHV